MKDFVPMTGSYKGKTVFVDGPEYETIAGCGSNLGIFDPFTILEMNFYCDAYGLDTISVGTSIAFAMECFEMGLINSNHTHGMDLSFGNRLNALELVHQMATGEGFGVTVGQDIRRMKTIFAQEFGANPAIMQDIGNLQDLMLSCRSLLKKPYRVVSRVIHYIQYVTLLSPLKIKKGVVGKHA